MRHVLEMAIPRLSHYPGDSEESQMFQLVAGPGKWRDGEGEQT